MTNKENGETLAVFSMKNHKPYSKRFFKFLVDTFDFALTKLH